MKKIERTESIIFLYKKTDIEIMIIKKLILNCFRCVTYNIIDIFSLAHKTKQNDTVKKNCSIQNVTK